MASIAKEPNGRRRILFVAPDGKRKTIRLGKVPQRAAEAINTKVEALLAAAMSSCPWDAETARWVADLQDDLAGKLAQVGLIPRRASSTLDAFLESYIGGRTDLKPRTLMKLRTTQEYLLERFGADKPLRDFTPGDADGWRLYLLEKGHSENTARKHIAITKQLFTAAARRRLIPSNPFADLKSGIQANPERFYFLPLADAYKVLDACPDTEWRLIFALSRFGGLRCPSEHLGLRWVDVDWAGDRMTIRSPKTERHPGGASRVIPIFPELRPILAAAFDEAADGAEYVITKYRDTNQNLRTQLERVIRRAGLEPWPKLFQNLRSTRQTELEETFPSHVVCKWIGNSQKVAAKHYLQVTEEHFRKAAQIPAQSAHVRGGKAQEPGSENWEIPKEYDALPCLTMGQVARNGLEQPVAVAPTVHRGQVASDDREHGADQFRVA
jgi:integrase